MDDFLTGRRAAQPGFVEPSFPTIAGSGPNGAIIHYRAQPGSCNGVDDQQLLLVDSGALLSSPFPRNMHPCSAGQAPFLGGGGLQPQMLHAPPWSRSGAEHGKRVPQVWSIMVSALEHSR